MAKRTRSAPAVWREWLRGLVVGPALLVLLAGRAAAEPTLAIDVFTAGDPGYGVTSTIVYGPTEALLVDAQFLEADAALLADRIDALGRRLVAIFVTHPDTDHLVGLALLHRRFPDARICMTEAGIAAYRTHIAEVREEFSKSLRPNEAPPLEPLARPLTQMSLAVDGANVEIVPDMQGDVADAPVNSVVWIPSLKTLVAGDLVFDRVHLWLDKSTPATRAAWRAALAKLQAMDAAVVIPGHAPQNGGSRDPSLLAQNIVYLETFDRALSASTEAEPFVAAMKTAYPDFAHTLFLEYAARGLYAKAG